MLLKKKYLKMKPVKSYISFFNQQILWNGIQYIFMKNYSQILKHPNGLLKIQKLEVNFYRNHQKMIIIMKLILNRFKMS